MRQGHLFVLSAPSGAGKSTLIDRAILEIPNTWHSISATTRAPRDYEEEGRHYFFLSHEEFEKALGEDHFLESATVHGEFYGTPSASVDARMADGDDVIMDLDVQGALQVKQRRPEIVMIFIMPPSIEELRKRIEGRQTETEESIQRRLSIAEKEMGHRDEYDHIIVNDVIDVAYAELAKIIETYRLGKEETGP
ncbi:MAG: guanylate kinase [Nitrospinaceae bacterium]|jgi:guanylate kinase|nr:guanylate kinase [Nitrospinaceae bacterium]MBT3434669.1 guanylate kinase [Nitrospinaceae bacterium]MBT3823329.1 guanylate kinase [Nitrospinaceae bacterium]MBT4095919.1 guanylate kinase [Nitrospinaceae bacterium]MBT4430079.1 guanylate kinase [Nitrospinaceae bacterium]